MYKPAEHSIGYLHLQLGMRFDTPGTQIFPKVAPGRHWLAYWHENLGKKVNTLLRDSRHTFVLLPVPSCRSAASSGKADCGSCQITFTGSVPSAAAIACRSVRPACTLSCISWKTHYVGATAAHFPPQFFHHCNQLEPGFRHEALRDCLRAAIPKGTHSPRDAYSTPAFGSSRNTW